MVGESSQTVQHEEVVVKSPLFISKDEDSSSGPVVRVSTSRAGGGGLIPGPDRPKALKLVVVAFPLGAQDHGNSTAIGCIGV